MTHSDSHPEPEDGYPRHRSRLRSRYRTAFWWSMGISLLLHLGVLLLYPRLLQRIPSGALPPPSGAAPATPSPGTEVVNLVELPSEEEVDAPRPEEESEPEPEVPAEPSAVPSAGAGEESPEAVEGEAPTTAAEALRPRAGDPRLWAPVDPELTDLSREEYLRLRLLAELEGMADSAAIAEEIARRAREWTYTDEDGRTWGVSPGKLHLGDVTLPLPFAFGAPPAVREGMGDRVWEWDEIQRGAEKGDILRTWKERAEAIRKRKEAERKADTTGTGG